MFVWKLEMQAVIDKDLDSEWISRSFAYVWADTASKALRAIQPHIDWHRDANECHVGDLEIVKVSRVSDKDKPFVVFS